MAAKMESAFDKDNKVITIAIAMAESSNFQPPLSCKCGALVNFVNGYSREVGEKIIYVTPFFRLKNNHVHDSDCDYNVEGQIKVIARESEGDIITQSEPGKFELRLLSVKKAIQDLRDLVKKKEESGSGPQGMAREKEYIKSEKKLGSYINSALRVLKVRSICEENKEIENLLELVFDGVRLPWRDFYYEDADYFRCYSNVKNFTVSTPVAVKGVIKTINVINGKSGKLLVINLAGPYRKTEDQNVREAANLSIWSPDIEAFSNYKPDDSVIAFGIWNVKEVCERPNNKPESNIKTFRNFDLRLWPVGKSQLCKTKS